MAGMVRVEGAKKLALIGKSLRLMGDDRTIIKNLTKRIKGLAPEIRTGIRDSAVATLPRAGGLGAWVAKSRVNVSVTRGARNAAVRVVVGRNSKGQQSDIAAIDGGGTRHPLWGNRHFWYPQRVNPNFATKVVQGPIGDRFQAETVNAIDDSIAEVLRGL